MMVALDGLTAGFGAYIDKQFSGLATNIITLSTSQSLQGGPGEIGGGAPIAPKITFNSAVVGKIKSLPFVNDVISTYSGQITLQSRGKSSDVTVLAIDPAKLFLMAPTLEFVKGSSPVSNDPSSIFVADSIANPSGEPIPFLFIGQTVSATYSYVDPDTGESKTELKSFIVRGIIKSTGNYLIDKAVMINEDTGNSLLHKSGKFDSLMVVTPSSNYVSIVVQEIKTIYKNNVGITTPDATLKTQKQLTSGFSTFISAIALVALVVGAVGIITTLYTSVTERVREIGTMKAIGFQNSDILILFMSEAAIIGVFGATIGLLLGVVSGIILTAGFSLGGGISTITPVFLVTDLLFVWFLSVFLSLVAGIYPAWKASRLSPMVAIRSH